MGGPSPEAQRKGGGGTPSPAAQNDDAASRLALLASFLDALPLAVFVVDPEGRPNYSNARADELLGRGADPRADRDELAKVYEAFVAGTDEIYPTERLPIVRALSGDRVSVDDMEIRRPDGRVRLRVSGAPIYGEDGELAFAVAVFEDITEESAAVEVRSRLAAIVDTSDEAILTWSLDGTILTWNVGAERLYGYSAEEAVGGSMTMLVPRDRPHEIEWIVDTIRRGERVEPYETVRVRKDGTAVHVLVGASPIHDATGRIVAVSSIGRDITARKQAERAAERALERERETARLLRETDEIKNVFLRALSHDVRNRLTAIIGMTSLLESELAGRFELTEEQRLDAVQTSNQKAQQINRLLNHLLDLDRLLSGDVQPQLQPTDLVELARRACEDRSVPAEIVVEGGAEAIKADVDPVMFERVLENLLGNAAKYAGGEGRRIWVRMERQGREVRVSVEDEGPGVPDELKEKIFEPFERGADVRDTEGIGLGLAMVSRLVELHRGRTWVDDRPGGGAAFRIQIPG